jgi:sarcosine oxidase subunit gamma
MPEPSIARTGALDGLAGVREAAAMRLLPPAARFIFRGRPAAITAAGGAFGVALPQEPCRAATAGSRAALWLGPDEWLLLAPDDEAAAIANAFAAALGALPHALVDVSLRQVALEIEGPQAASVLNAGCPLDLHHHIFPVGMCTRTLLAKAEIVLWRTAEHRFRVEVGRSFGPYVWRFLEEVSL